MVANQAEKILEKKWGTEVEIGEVDYSLPSWISLKYIYIEDLNNDTLIAAERLRVDITMLKLLSNEVEINRFMLEDAYVNLYRTKPDTSFNFHFMQGGMSTDAPSEPEQKKDTTSKLDFQIKDIVLKNVRFNFNDYSGGVLFNIGLDSLYAKGEKTDVSTLLFHMDDVVIKGVNSSLVLDESIIPPDNDTTTTYPTILIDEVKLADINYKMDDRTTPRQQYGIDYLHLDVEDLNLVSKNTYYHYDSISGVVKHLSLKENTGDFILEELKTKFAYHDNGAYLHDLLLKTDKSVIKNYLEISYPSIEAISNNPEVMQLDIDIEESVVAVEDILTFAPDLRTQDVFRKYPNDRIRLDADISGKLDALNITNLYAAGLDNTLVRVQGKIYGIPNTNRISYDLNIPVLKTTRSDLLTFIPRSAVKDINLPSSFKLNGRISGSLEDYNLDVLVSTPQGATSIDGYVRMSPGSGREKYNVKLNTRNLDLGYILKKQDQFGKITSNLHIQGRGFDPDNLTASVNGHVSSFWAMGYNYNNIDINGTIRQKVAAMELISSDPNVDMRLDLVADLNKEYIQLNGLLDAARIDLQALGFTDDKLIIETRAAFDVPALNPDYPYGDITLTETGIITDSQQIYFDSAIFVRARSTPETGQDIYIKSAIAEASITGLIPLTKAPVMVRNQIDKYYPLSGVEAPDTNVYPPVYDLHVDATIKNKPLLRTFLPGLKTMYPVTIDADVSERNLSLVANIPSLTYNDLFVDSGKVIVNSTDTQSLNYDIAAKQISQGSMHFYNPTVYGSFKDSILSATAKVHDAANEQRFGASLTMLNEGDRQVIHLQDSLMLNYEKWDVNNKNKVVLEQGGLYAQNLKINNEHGSILLNSKRPEPSSPLDVVINDFLLSSITEILQQDTILVNGVLNSKLTVSDIMSNPKATGTLSVDDLSVMGDTIGQLNANLMEASANSVDTRMTISGRGNDIVIHGDYYAQPVDGNHFEMIMEINTMNAKTFQGLAMNNIKNTSGNITGMVTISGTFDQPKVDGVLHTDSLHTTLTMLGSPMLMPSEEIYFNKNKVEFKNFKILDKHGNYGLVDGTVDISNISDPQLDLYVKSENWEVIDSDPGDNDLFYGRMLISSNLNVNGAPSAPELEGKITVHDSTDFNIVVPENSQNIERRKGVVQFVQLSSPERYRYMVLKDTMPQYTLDAGAELNLNITVEEEAKFTVQIDAASGDLLTLQGEADLNTQINPDGSIGLAGAYILDDGSYEFNYSLVKRKFIVQEGSEIKFAGDPTKAEVDIKAVYTANIAPYELVENEVGNDRLVYYKQRLPFEVVLNMQGKILDPEITFDIKLPEEQRYRATSEVIAVVRGKLQEIRINKSELNKQVFAALILNRFIQNDPFQSLGGTDVEYIARQSASRFISAQLNRLADDYIQGLDVNMDLISTEDYTSGSKQNRTDLNIVATKALMNDRLSVTVGNNFAVENGDQTNNNGASAYIPGTLSAKYLLTEDGRYAVKAFRRRDNINVIEGEYVETGASFLVTLDYDKFGEIFKKKKEKKKVENEDKGLIEGTQ